MTHWGFTLENVTASWSEDGNNNILEGLDFAFQIFDAKTAALPLMGPSGQGKSTLLYLLAALKLPAEGTVTWRFPNDSKTYIFRQEVAQQHHIEDVVQLRRNHFGFAFQNSTLSPYLTVRENIAYPLVLQGKPWNDALQIAANRFEEVLLPTEKDNKNSLLARFPDQLSGGQLQRAALAQAIIHDPDVLFADEPTGQLDLRTRKQVMGVLKQWLDRGDGQRCLIWVTHHHIGDLKMMGVDNLLFIENKGGISRNSAWLENWVDEYV
jgi:putative ABC transport system ATP-binding protein